MYPHEKETRIRRRSRSRLIYTQRKKKIKKITRKKKSLFSRNESNSFFEEETLKEEETTDKEDYCTTTVAKEMKSSVTQLHSPFPDYNKILFLVSLQKNKKSPKFKTIPFIKTFVHQRRQFL